MNSIDVLIVVDVENALATSNLQDNVYMVDNNKHFGSGHEGQSELITACQDGQLINWAVTPIAATDNVSIQEFTGDMVNQKICQPQSVKTVDSIYWQGRVESRGETGTVQYSVVLNLEGKPLSFDPFLNISKV